MGVPVITWRQFVCSEACPKIATRLTVRCLSLITGCGGVIRRAVIIDPRLAGSAVALETAGRGIGGAGYLPRW
jgi:hypothetical protein